MSEAIQDEPVIRLGGKLLLEEMSKDCPAFSISQDLLKKRTWESNQMLAEPLRAKLKLSKAILSDQLFTDIILSTCLTN
jgi:hypothetical protein